MHDHGMLFSGHNRRAAALAIAMLSSCLTFAPTAYAQTSAGPVMPAAAPATPLPQSKQTLEEWRAGMAQTPAPKAGCFTAEFPSGEWKETPCATRKVPDVPFPPRRGGRPEIVVGNGNDVSAKATTGTLSKAVGSFDSATGVTSETGPNPYLVGNPVQPNTFTLQLNTNFFNTPVCLGTQFCLGWEQFVYENNSVQNSSFIQYWLIRYNATCPTGWNTYQPQPGETDCWRNSDNSVTVPNQPISNLTAISLTGQAVAGGNDTFITAVGTTLYSFTGPDSMVDLAQGWTEAEFNIFGDCCSTAATFNAGSSLVVREAVNNGTLGAPACDSTGYTGETNNLSFATAPTPVKGTLPAVLFTEGSSVTTENPCAAATAVSAVSNCCVAAIGDFYGAGRNNTILWRFTDGSVGTWEVNGPSTTAIGTDPVVPATWKIAGAGDFYNAGHNNSLLWRNSDGTVAIWELNGSTITAAWTGPFVPTTWTIVGTGDFYNTGHNNCILWRNSDGTVAMWEMNGSTITAAWTGPVVPTSWTVAGTGDFYNTGHNNSILWRNSDGTVAMWQMSGGSITAPWTGPVVPTDWTIAGPGDIYNTGHNNGILWRDANGTVALWQMNGPSITAPWTGPVVPTSWTIVGAGDLYNTGHNNGILWRNSDGTVATWQMNGSTIAASGFF